MSNWQTILNDPGSGLETPPKPARADLLERGQERWSERATDLGEAPNDANFRKLLEAILGNSPHLSDCLIKEPAILAEIIDQDCDGVLSNILKNLNEDLVSCDDRSKASIALRQAKRRGILTIAIADIANFWSVEKAFAALSMLAEKLLQGALSFLLREGQARGHIRLADIRDPQLDCGYVILAMGKLGAGELNYSSDVDLIVIFDPAKETYLHSRGPQEGFARLTRDLVRLLEERTAEGYVYRTDLRLRPDPGAMPLAISYISALTYYESLGQNWERAAMIKARPVAGDLEMGQAFLSELRPFVWRKHLDFWAIQDIHSIKRQINAQRGGSEIAVLGHNIKLGRGGIREIEFYAQTQQLIWGGRNPNLRSPQTLQSLESLATCGHIELTAARALQAAYLFHRRLENRIQMIDDQQTHDLPKEPEALAELACFLGYKSAPVFEEALLGHLRAVEELYAKLFEEAPDLGGSGNLVFTGGEPEPGTIATLTEMGFEEPPRVFEVVRSWHHGRYRATRSTRARELLTELMPRLLQALGATPEPDQALLRFDAFLSGLPTGVQLFAMLHAQPRLLDLIAEIMGAAPKLAHQLAIIPIYWTRSWSLASSNSTLKRANSRRSWRMRCAMLETLKMSWTSTGAGPRTGAFKPVCKYSRAAPWRKPVGFLAPLPTLS